MRVYPQDKFTKVGVLGQSVILLAYQILLALHSDFMKLNPQKQCRTLYASLHPLSTKCDIKF